MIGNYDPDMKKNVGIVVSSPMTINAFLLGQIKALAETYNVYIFANLGNEKLNQSVPSNVEIFNVKISRSIKPWEDLCSYFNLIRLFRKLCLHLVHSVTPKAGLLTMLAAKSAGVNLRLHTFTGQVWATKSGISRLILKNVDRIMSSLATLVLVDSPSQQKFLIDSGITSKSKSMVLNSGSISGVDIKKYQYDALQRRKLRTELNIQENDILLLFVGRLKKEKGIYDLLAAYRELRKYQDNIALGFVGPDEENIRETMLGSVEQYQEKVFYIPYTQNPESYYQASDVLCLPSYREGFGTVIIEAAACSVPAVASRIYGITDAIVDNETGLLHEPGDVNDLVMVLMRLVQDADLRVKLGNNARLRARAEFAQEILTESLLNLYTNLLH